MKYSDEQLTKHFGAPKGFSRVSNTLTRLYTLLDGFDASTIGLYAYLRSWRNTSDPNMKGIVWHSREYMYLQSGLGRTAFASRLNKLIEVGLVEIIKSPTIPNKDYFIVYDPLDRDTFIEKFGDKVDKFFNDVDELEDRLETDRLRRKRIEYEKLQQEIEKRFPVDEEITS